MSKIFCIMPYNLRVTYVSVSLEVLVQLCQVQTAFGSESLVHGRGRCLLQIFHQSDFPDRSRTGFRVNVVELEQLLQPVETPDLLVLLKGHLLFSELFACVLRPARIRMHVVTGFNHCISFNLIPPFSTSSSSFPSIFLVALHFDELSQVDSRIPS